MGRYYPENYAEKVKLDGYEIPCQCWVEVSGGGKVIVTQNRIKEMTGWKDRKVKITGRLEGSSEDELAAQVKSLMSLGQKEKALSIISKETDSQGIRKIVLENDPQITLIQGFDLSRNLSIEGTEDSEDEKAFDLAKEKKENVKRLTDPKKKEKTKKYIVKSGDTLSGLSVRFYGNYRLWKHIYKANQSVIGRNPDLILPGQELEIPTLSTQESEHIVRVGDTVASVAAKYNISQSLLRKTNPGLSMIESAKLTIPPQQSQGEKSFAEAV